MNGTDLYERFSSGTLYCDGREKAFADVAWSPHPVFEGVRLKHLVTSQQTGGLFSYHLVEIAPGKSIGRHVHAEQLETHEVAAGCGICLDDGREVIYTPGTVAVLRKNTPHEVQAGDEGLYLFAKFIPALN